METQPLATTQVLWWLPNETDHKFPGGMTLNSKTNFSSVKLYDFSFPVRSSRQSIRIATLHGEDTSTSKQYSAWGLYGDFNNIAAPMHRLELMDSNPLDLSATAIVKGFASPSDVKKLVIEFQDMEAWLNKGPRSSLPAQVSAVDGIIKYILSMGSTVRLTIEYSNPPTLKSLLKSVSKILPFFEILLNTTPKIRSCQIVIKDNTYLDIILPIKERHTAISPFAIIAAPIDLVEQNLLQRWVDFSNRHPIAISRYTVYSHSSNSFVELRILLLNQVYEDLAPKKIEIPKAERTTAKTTRKRSHKEKVQWVLNHANLTNIATNLDKDFVREFTSARHYGAHAMKNPFLKYDEQDPDNARLLALENLGYSLIRGVLAFHLGVPNYTSCVSSSAEYSTAKYLYQYTESPAIF